MSMIACGRSGRARSARCRATGRRPRRAPGAREDLLHDLLGASLSPSAFSAKPYSSPAYERIERAQRLAGGVRRDAGKELGRPLASTCCITRRVRLWVRPLARSSSNRVMAQRPPHMRLCLIERIPMPCPPRPRRRGTRSAWWPRRPHARAECGLDPRGITGSGGGRRRSGCSRAERLGARTTDADPRAGHGRRTSVVHVQKHPGVRRLGRRKGRGPGARVRGEPPGSAGSRPRRRASRASSAAQNGHS
jgi:hypothetical protein